MIFETYDPNIYIDLQGIVQPQRVVIHLNCLTWGAETYKYISQEKSAIIDAKDAEIQHKTAEFNQKDVELTQVAAALQAKDADLAQAATALQAKDVELAQAATALQAKDADLAQAAAALQAKDMELTQAATALQAKDMELTQAATALQAKDVELAQAATALQAKDADLVQAAAALQAKDTDLAQAATALQAKDMELTQAAATLQAKDTDLAQAAAALQAKDIELQQYVAALQQKDAELQQKLQLIQRMENTLSWKFTKPLRAIRNFRLLKNVSYHDNSWKGKLLRFGGKTLWPKRLIRQSGLFYEAYYLANNPDVAQAKVNPLRHFLRHGGFEGRKPHPDFDSAYYLEHNPDVKEARLNPLIHYLIYGGFESRKPNSEFDSAYYLESNPDVKASGMNPLVHYITYGRMEDRQTVRSAICSTAKDGSQSLQPEKKEHIVLLKVINRSGQTIELSQACRNAVKEEKIFGCLDQAELKDDCLIVKGWVIADSGIQKIEVYLDSHFVENPSYGLLRSDVNQVYPDSNQSEHAGFYLCKDVSEFLQPEQQEYLVFIKAVSVDGQTIEFSQACRNDVKSEEKRGELEKLADVKLRAFLETLDMMQFPEFDQPLLSIILILFNRSELTFQCLESIKAHADLPYEIVIVDNASSDNTTCLLECLKNVKMIKNTENVGFLKACNQAVDYARGKYVLFLNNDTQILPHTLSHLVKTIESDPKIGVVGGKLIFPNGTLQEAGSIIWKDGSCVSYGRGDHPFRPEYCYVKEVYYCSGALLLTPRQLFLELGKFDEQYSPAYCEEVDYCMNICAKGYKVIYQPLAQIIHHEFASSQRLEEAINLQVVNRAKLVKKWGYMLAEYADPHQEKVFLARGFPDHTNKKHILYIDDRVPDPKLGSGYPRSFDILQTLIEFGYHITLFPLWFIEYSGSAVIQDLQQKGVEVIYDHTRTKGALSFGPFLARKNRHSSYDIMLVSRRHNMEHLVLLYRHILEQTSMQIIYDCEAITTPRQVLYQKLQGQLVSVEEEERLIRTEIDLARRAHKIITVSKNEKAVFEKYGIHNIHIIGFSMKSQPTVAAFEERKDLLFVGAIFPTFPNPNEDAMLYFAKEVYPEIYKATNAKLLIVGTNKSEAVQRLHSEQINILGQVDSLWEYYNQCRVFVVPTRYAAGIPYKLHEAASFGLPAVVTPLIAEQIGWEEGKSLLIGYDQQDFAQKCITLYTRPELWASIRRNALEMIQRDCNPQGFKNSLYQAIESDWEE